ncbi:MAG: hypothetical protein ACTHOD_15985 [Motilibacteraceae bacterium]
MDESRDSGMQSGWPGEWPRPEPATAPAPVLAGQDPGPAAPARGPREATEWPGWSSDQSAGARPDGKRRSPKGIVTAVGLVLAGALAGGIGIAAVQHGSTTTTETAAAQGLPGAAGAAGGQGRPGQGFPGGFGRDDGEQRFVGTLTSVSGSSVTVRTQSGTATYQVSDQTQVVKDGQAANLSDLAAGDQVLVHVIPGGSTPTVERIIAGRLPQPGDLGLPGGPDGGGQGDGQQGGGSSGGTTTGVRT